MTPDIAKHAAATASVTLVTPSYRFDFERCALLVESIRHCAPALPHVIIVDRPDLARFRSLQGPKTTVVDSRELLDPRFHRVPGRSGWWVSTRTLPLRGWMTQQLRKLAVHRILDSEVIVNVDSDVAFIRPLDPAILFRDDRLALFAVDYRNDELVRWTALARRLLGRDGGGAPMNHVGMMICWWRAQVIAMLDRVGAVTGLPWQTAIARQRTFSEYQLYGSHILDGDGAEATRHFRDDRPLIATSWHHDLSSPPALDAFMRGVGPEAIGVMVHSKDAIPPATYRAHLEHHWRGA